MATRTLTVLFTDVVGSTQLGVKLGEREAERLRQAHFATLRRQLERHRGREVKNLGDGVMATFEAARDGLECAVAIQQATARMVDALAGPLAIRVGLSSGDVQPDGEDCFGAPVVEASRLCAAAAAGQVLVAEAARRLARDYEPVEELGELQLKGLREPTRVWEARWSPDAPARLRAVVADDAALMREGIAHVLEAAGIEVVGQAGDGDELLRLVAEARPDVAIVDVRMPPTWTDEGLELAELIGAEHAGTGVLILSQDVEPRYAERLLATRPAGVGYLLKDRVADGHEFADAARRVAAGGRAFEPAVLRDPETAAR